MINQLPTRSAERPAIANPGQRVTITIAARLTGTYGGGYILDYMGTVFLAENPEHYEVVDKQAGLVRVTILASIVSHDGLVGYVVAVTGAQLRIHEQNIVEVL